MKKVYLAKLKTHQNVNQRWPLKYFLSVLLICHELWMFFLWCGPPSTGRTLKSRLYIIFWADRCQKKGVEKTYNDEKLSCFRASGSHAENKSPNSSNRNTSTLKTTSQGILLKGSQHSHDFRKGRADLLILEPSTLASSVGRLFWERQWQKQNAIEVSIVYFFPGQTFSSGLAQRFGVLCKMIVYTDTPKSICIELKSS